MLAEIGFKGLKVSAILGVLDHEREKQQSIRVDLSVWLDIQSAAIGDELEASVDYADLSQRTVELIQDKKRMTIEALVRDISQDLYERYFEIQRVRVRIEKPEALASAESAFVCLDLNREEMDREFGKA